MKNSRPPGSSFRAPSPKGSSGHPASLAHNPDTAEIRDKPDADEIRRILALVKDKLTRGARYSEVMDEFFTLLGTDLAFLREGDPVEDSPLLDALVPMAAQMARKPLHLIEMSLVRLPEHRLTHGMMFFDGWLGVVVLFEDVGMGILGLGEANMRGPTVYGRFSYKEMQPPRKAPRR